MGRSAWTTCFAFCGLLALGTTAEAAEWPQFRGPYRTGISPETGLIRAWPDGGPPERWRHPIGAAFSGIAAAGGYLYTTESDAEGDYLLKLDPETGRTLWRRRIAPVYEEYFGNGPRATPTVEGDQVFVLSGDGHLVALGTGEGTILWSRDLRAEFGVELPQWGFASAPLVLGKRLIIDVGAAEQRAVVAFDRTLGEVLWTAGEGQHTYGSPVVVDAAGRRQLVQVNKQGVLGLSPDGDELWQHEWFPENDIKPALPIFVAPDLLFVSASYGIGAMAMRVTAEGVEELWRNKVMRNHFNSSVLVDGMVYGFDSATLKCVDPRTGEQKWARRGGLGKGSLIYADGLLIVLTETGTLKLLEATPTAYTELASHQVLSGRCWTEPTLTSGRLYLRNREEVVAFDLRSPSTAPARAEAPGATHSATRSDSGSAGLTLEQILARHVEARGGPKRLQAIRSLRLRGVYETSGIGRPFTMSRKDPNLYHFETTTAGQTVIRANDDKVVWTVDAHSENPGPQVLEERLAQLATEDTGDLLGPLVDAGRERYRLELVGATELDGVLPAYHLRLHLPSGRTQSWYVSRESYLVVKKEVPAYHSYFGDYTREYWYMEHEAYEGVVLPRFIERVDETVVATLRIESVELNPELDDALFACPD